MKKAYGVLTGTLVALAAVSIPVLAAGTASSGAQQAAQSYLPADSVLVETDWDDGLQELKYYHRDRQEVYELKLDANQALVEFDSELLDDRGSRTVTLTEQQAQQAVTNELADAQILSTRLDYDDGLQEYEVRFQTEKLYGEYKVHPETGAVLSREIKVGASNVGATYIGREKAIQIAQQQAPGATVWECKLDRDDGFARYELELRDGLWEYEFEIDAVSGRILKSERDFD